MVQSPVRRARPDKPHRDHAKTPSFEEAFVSKSKFNINAGISLDGNLALAAGHGGPDSVGTEAASHVSEHAPRKAGSGQTEIYRRFKFLLFYFSTSCSIFIKRLYFSTRSLRDKDPVLINSAFTATARSAMNVSAVSPDRCETEILYPCSRAN